MDDIAFFSRQTVLGFLFLHQDMIEKKYQTLLRFVDHPGGRLQTIA